LGFFAGSHQLGGGDAVSTRLTVLLTLLGEIMNTMKYAVAFAVGLGVCAPALQAQVTNIGLPQDLKPAGVTFSGTGIPGPVMTGVTASGARLTIGASPRFSAPALGWDGAGTYTAQAGSTTSPLRSLWNFNFAVTDVVNATDHTYGLFWDFDNASGSTSYNGFFFNVATGGNVQNSWNLAMAFIDPSNSAPNYDPNDVGEFTFILAAYDYEVLDPNQGVYVGVNPLGYSPPIQFVSMQVNVVPEPSTYALMAFGLGAIGFVGRRRRNALRFA